MRAELAQDRGHVSLDGGFGNLQFVGDLFVQQAVAHHRQHAVLLRRELGDASGDTVIVRSGLTGNEQIATTGSFTLKAEIGKGEASHED